MSRFRWSTTFVAGLALLVMAGCQTMTGRTAGQYVDDGKITTEVKTRLAADTLSNLTRVGVTTTNGVVYLTGSVDSPERSTRAAELASQVSGVQRVVNEIQVAQATPPAVASAPAPLAGHPPIDASGTVSSYDPPTGILTFTDGQSVRVTGNTMWQSSRPGTIQPGAQVFVHNAEPVGVTTSQAVSPARTWRLGTVSRVDTTSGLLYLTDGTVVHVGPSPIVQSNNQPITLEQIRPGTQVAIGTPTGLSASPSTAPSVGSALPRQTPPPPPAADTTEIIIFPAR